MISKHEKKELNSLIHQILEKRDQACLKCGNPEFQASHIYPKGSYRKLEFDPENIIALCYRHHLHWWHKNPLEAHDWINETYPDRMKRLKLMTQSGAGTRNYKLLKVYLKNLLKTL